MMLRSQFACTALVLIAVFAVPPSHAALEDAQRFIDRLLAEHPTTSGVSLWIEGPTEQLQVGSSTGRAAPGGPALSVETPVRIASNTKTFVAAAYLRLWELGRAPLDTPIQGMVDPVVDALLQADGYDTRRITPRHLLYHSAGLANHADEQYLKLVLLSPSREWTPIEQLAVLTRYHDPLSAPGEAFHYSDSGYVLLGHLIERLTGQTLASNVRSLLRFDALGLSSTWWELHESRPAMALPRAHQGMGGMDTHDWHASLDLHGGGGLVASPKDLARFWAALFGGDVFDNPATLTFMVSAPGQVAGAPYRSGLFIEQMGGHKVYQHGGFWGTMAVYLPGRDIAIAGVVLTQEDYAVLKTLISRVLAQFQ